MNGDSWLEVVAHAGEFTLAANAPKHDKGIQPVFASITETKYVIACPAYCSCRWPSEVLVGLRVTLA